MLTRAGLWTVDPPAYDVEITTRMPALPWVLIGWLADSSPQFDLLHEIGGREVSSFAQGTLTLGSKGFSAVKDILAPIVRVICMPVESYQPLLTMGAKWFYIAKTFWPPLYK
jgi:hypothetical protein